MYIMIVTRSDISYTVTRLANPNPRPRKTKFFPYNENKACLKLFKKHNQSVSNIPEITKIPEIRGILCHGLG